MILGADHISLSTSDTSAAVESLQAGGYQIVFEQRGLENHVAKKPFLNRYQPIHDLVLMRSPAHANLIEVTNHGQVDASEEGSFEVDPSGIALSTVDIAEEHRFLCSAFGFHEQSARLASLPSPVPAWRCSLSLKERKSPSRSHLDSEGHTCLALVSNDLAGDIKRAIHHGALEVTEIFAVCVNKKPLDIALLRSPPGTIYELIQPRRGS